MRVLHHWTYAVLAALLSGWSPLHAQDLLQVYALAKQHDPVIREVRERLLAALESKPQARALLLPKLSASGGYDLVHDDVKKPSLLKGSEGYDKYNAQLGVNQPIYHRDYWIRQDQADDTIAQAEAELKNAEIGLMVRTATAYFNILAAADELRVRRAEKEANASQLDQARQRFEVGLVAITDVHESKAAYDGAVAAEIAAENALSDRWEDLRKIIGNSKEPLAKLGDEMPLKKPTPNDIEAWAKTALSKNYGIIAARHATALARKNIEVERSGHYPTLDLVGSYGRVNSNAGLGSERDEGLIGVQLNLSLYEGGAVTSRTRQAQHEFQAAQDQLDQRRREVNRQVRSAFRGVISTISRVEALKSTMISFQSALESTQAGLEVGTRTMVDVLTVTRSLYQAQSDYARSRYDYIINTLQLHQAASTLSEEGLARANAWLLPDDTVAPPF